MSDSPVLLAIRRLAHGETLAAEEVTAAFDLVMDGAATPVQVAALLTGLGSMLLGFPFLTTHTAHWSLPILGEVHVPSAMFFDVGVFAAVVGSTLMILVSLAHQSIRGRRRRVPAAPGARDLEGS